MVQAVLTQSEKDKGFILKCSSALDLSSIAKESVDLIITSPPYNVGIEYSSNSDTLTYKQYLQFSEEWIRNCYHWSKNTGRLCINVPLDKINMGKIVSVPILRR